MNPCNHILNALFPSVCPACHTHFIGISEPICTECMHKASEQFHMCMQAPGETSDDRQYYLSRLFYLSIYDGFAKALLQLAKFSSDPRAIRLFYGILKKKLADCPIIPETLPWDYVIPVPSRSQLNRRLAAAAFGNLPVRELFGKKGNIQSKKLNRFDRFFEIEKTLLWKSGVELPDRDARYLLLDDLWTTGATMNRLCRLLSEKGVPTANIDGLVLFLKPRHQDLPGNR